MSVLTIYCETNVNTLLIRYINSNTIKICNGIKYKKIKFLFVKRTNKLISIVDKYNFHVLLIFATLKTIIYTKTKYGNVKFSIS